jgi:histidinol phosphatase-like PHP family hydrolase
VAQIAIKEGVNLVFNTDSHGPEDLMDMEGAKKILLGAGLNPEQAEEAFQNAYRLAEKV